jgi:hypothetical protein
MSSGVSRDNFMYNLISTQTVRIWEALSITMAQLRRLQHQQQPFALIYARFSDRAVKRTIIGLWDTRAPHPPPVACDPAEPPRRPNRRQPPRRTNHHRQPIRRSSRNRRPSRKQREAFETTLAAMTCPDRCPDPDQTMRDDITHAALSVDTGAHFEYHTLLKSSDGPKEIVRLAQPMAASPRPKAPTPFDSSRSVIFPRAAKQRTCASAQPTDRPTAEGTTAPSSLHRGRRSTMDHYEYQG